MSYILDVLGVQVQLIVNICPAITAFHDTRAHTHARTPVSVTLFVFSSQVTSGEFLPAQRTWHAKFESRCSLRRWTMFPARLKSVNRRYGDTTRFRCPLLSVTAQMILMCPFYGDIRSRLLLFHIRHFLVDRQ